MVAREDDLLGQLDTAKRIQIELAKKMMADMQLVRDEWAMALQEKEMELKRAEVEFEARAEQAIEQYQAA